MAGLFVRWERKFKLDAFGARALTLFLAGALYVFSLPGVLAFDTYINNSDIFVERLGVGTSSLDGIFNVDGDAKILNGDFVVNRDFTVGYENLTHGKLRFDDLTQKLQFSNDNGSNWIDFTELNKAGISWTPRSNPVDNNWL
ncbi:MAG: hypothetical protein MI892_31605, partial [Desulfobacterales bacterium]|nr:hypothetical protein [Desulfobacterales bacterium]